MKVSKITSKYAGVVHCFFHNDSKRTWEGETEARGSGVERGGEGGK